MWAQVPNWRAGDPMWIRKPEPPWIPPPRQKGQPRPKRPPPHDPETLDWLVALNEVDLEKAAALDPETLIPVEKGKKPAAKNAPDPSPSPSPAPTAEDWAQARAQALEVVALVRGIAASRRLDAAEPIFKVAFEPEGVFRDECGRQIRGMESFAVPSLIRLMHDKGRPAKQRRYASYQLDRMDRARPQKAISAAPDDVVRAAIVHEYGEQRALEAVEAILGQVDAGSHRVRKEARWAWLRYVTGKAPPPAPMRKRKLPGGREEEEEKPDYLTYREIAVLALQKELTEINGAAPSPKATAKEMTDELFAHYDKKRAEAWDLEFLAAQQKEAGGDYQAATDEYGWILARDPNYARRGEMARAFARRGDELRKKGELARAVSYLRQAVDLQPGGPEAKAAEARVLHLDGLRALEMGAPDPRLFRRALALDPSLTEAGGALLRAESSLGRRKLFRGGISLGALFVLGFGLWLLWRRTG
jgi:tetratricopeptide (TPR) repeat protein